MVEASNSHAPESVKHSQRAFLAPRVEGAKANAPFANVWMTHVLHVIAGPGLNNDIVVSGSPQPPPGANF